jgi:hypothetical protein
VKQWLCGVVALLVACGGGDSTANLASGPIDPVRSDSAGVVLLSHEAGAFDRAPRITLDSAVIAEIQGSAEDESADISTIIPTLFLPDGRLVGRDRQRQVIVVFGADGSERQEFGRQGSGPGEYGFLGGMVPTDNGDLLVHDFRNGRLSRFNPATGPGEEYPLAQPIGAGGSQPVGMVGGKILMFGMNFQGGDTPVPPGVKAVLFDPATDQARRVFTTGPEEQEEEAPRIVSGSGGAVMAVRAISITALEAMPTVFAWNGQYVVTDANQFLFEWRDTTGAVTQRLKVHQPREPVTDEVWNAYADQMIGQITGTVSSGIGVTMMVGGGTPDTAMMRRDMLAQPHADSLPAFERTHVTANGNLWVMDYPVPGREGWAATVFAHDGRILGRIVEPTGTAPVAFGDDRLAFRSEDELGIATITVRKVTFP